MLFVGQLSIHFLHCTHLSSTRKELLFFSKTLKPQLATEDKNQPFLPLKIHAEGLVCIYQTANFLYFRQRLPYYLDSGFFVGHFPARKIVVGHNDVGKSRKVKIPVFEYFRHGNACVTAAFAGSCNAVELVTALKLCLFQKFFDFLRKTPCVYGGHNYKRTLRAENPRRTAFENVVQTDDIVACAVCNVVCYKTGVARCGKIQYHYSSCGIKTKRLVPFTNQSIKSLLQAKKRSLHSWKNNKGLHCLPVTTFDITVLASVARFFTLQKHMQKLTDTHIVTFFNFTTKGQKTTVFCKALPACYRKQHLEKTKICRKHPKRHRKKGKTVKFCTTHHNLFQRKQPCYEQWAVDTKHTATLRRFPVSGKTKATKQKEATKKTHRFWCVFWCDYRQVSCFGDPNGTRTHVIGVRGQRPRPLDYRAELL